MTVIKVRYARHSVGVAAGAATVASSDMLSVPSAAATLSRTSSDTLTALMAAGAGVLSVNEGKVTMAIGKAMGKLEKVTMVHVRHGI